MPVTVLVGTRKGAFLLRDEGDRRRWNLSGPQFPGWEVTAAARAGDRYYLATSSSVYGPAIHVSADLQRWEQVVEGPSYPEGERRLRRIWTLQPAGPQLFAGVADAGLFASADGGASWTPVDGLNDHPSRPRWSPGAGGLCAHVVLNDHTDPSRLWCGISAVGVFRSDDGGTSWTSTNAGVTVAAADEEDDSIGYCVHGLANDPANPDRIFRQDHTGVYRSHDGGDSWERCEQGLPATFGFPIARDHHTGALFVFPQESSEFRYAPGGRFSVYRSRNDGDTWEPLAAGPQQNAFTGVLRGAMDVDGLDPAGIYVGSSSGTLHLSVDGGEDWQTVPAVLPRILSVSVVEAG